MLVMGGAETHRKSACIILGPALSVTFPHVVCGMEHGASF